MKGRGKVTVYLCLIISAMVLLGTVVLRIVSIYVAKGKASMVARITMSDVKANYNSYIFEHYHILLFDKNNYGRGEASIEERMDYITRQNIGSAIVLDDVAITGYTLIYDDDCEELKKQIHESFMYGLVELGVDELNEKIGYSTSSYSNELDYSLLNVEQSCGNLDGESSSGETSNSETSNSESSNSEDGNLEVEEGSGNYFGSEEKHKDPRTFTRSFGKDSILLSVILPKDKEVSNEDIIPDDSLSRMKGAFKPYENIKSDFEDYHDMKSDMKKYSDWGNGISEKGEALFYSKTVFNSYENSEKNKESVMKCEMEYLIAGKKSDYENLNSVCHRMVGLRLPINMCFLLSDVKRMSIVKSISIPISAYTAFIAEPIIRYLIAGAWSYAESMAEVKNLLRGNRIEFVKKSSNWITDIDNLAESIDLEQDSSKGLSYEDYLLLLLAMEDDTIYYRMLDIMDVNAKTCNPEFSIMHGVTAFEADFAFTIQNVKIAIRQFATY